jgi:hypothetical protein
MGLVFVLEIRVITGLRRQKFEVPVDLTGPATLTVEVGSFGGGNNVSIIDEEGEKRAWFADKIYTIKFEFRTEQDEPAQSTQEVGVLSAHEQLACEMLNVPQFP